jgi:hypothetical protein
MNTPGDPIEILLVEDNPGDAELVRYGLRAGKISNHLTVAEYGADALAHLRGGGPGDTGPARTSSCWTSTCPT